MSPSDSHHANTSVMDSRRIVRARPRHDGPPRFLTNPPGCAITLYPGQLGGCIRLLLSHRWQASPPLAGWPLPSSVTRPTAVFAFATAHPFVVRGGPHLFARIHGPTTLPVRRYRHTTGRDYMLNRQLHGNLLSDCWTSQASLAHQIAQIGADYEPKERVACTGEILRRH